MFSNRTRTWLATGALVLGAGVGGAAVANAAGGSSSGTDGRQPPAQGQPPADPSKVGHGPSETLLTGTAAAKARAAALAKVPGATVIRVETDSGDAAYEAHLRKADGSFVTVEMDSSFHVTGTESGFGGPPPGTGDGMDQ
jgi:hypothetical protein